MRHSIITPTATLFSVLLGALCLVQTGCSVLEPKADNTRLYVLRAPSDRPAASADAKVTAKAIRVGPGRVASYLDVTPVVVQDGPNRVKQLDLHHWAEPLPKGISRVLAENLSQRLGGAQMIIYPEPASGAGVEVRYTISQLEGALDGPVKMTINWQIVDLASGKVVQARSTERTIAAANRAEDVAAYVERISRAIGEWSDEIADAIRSSETH